MVRVPVLYWRCSNSTRKAVSMISIKLTSVMVTDQAQARKFYTEVLGFIIKTDIPMGEFSWLTVVSPADPGGTELLLEPTGHPAARPFQQALYNDGVPLTAFAVDDIQQEYARLTALG